MTHHISKMFRRLLGDGLLSAFDEIDAICVETCRMSTRRVMGVTRHVVDVFRHVHGW
jgi:hypothetical protein